MKSIIWKFCYIAVLSITILIYTPLVTPNHQFEPKLIGIPYTLWVGLLVTLVLLFLTIIGSFVHPGRGENKAGSQES
jgi:hypothetical protein